MSDNIYLGDRELTYQDARDLCDFISERKGIWEGVPVPITDQPVTLYDGHPMASVYRKIDGVGLDIIVGGPALGDEYVEEVVNEWFSRKLNATITVWKATAPGKPTKYFHTKLVHSPDGSMYRLMYWLSSIGAVDAWDLDAEHRARDKLASLLLPHQWRSYDLTGAFLEHSSRSGLTYLFRRLRPTVVMSPRWPERGEAPTRRDESMRMLAVLCRHPVGYYQHTWAGCMVPTDDVIAHLLWMRGDEANYWGKANQHEPWTPEAGI
jgi:hypothetical protein